MRGFARLFLVLSTDCCTSSLLCLRIQDRYMVDEVSGSGILREVAALEEVFVVDYGLQTK